MRRASAGEEPALLSHELDRCVGLPIGLRACILSRPSSSPQLGAVCTCSSLRRFSCGPLSVCFPTLGAASSSVVLKDRSVSTSVASHSKRKMSDSFPDSCVRPSCFFHSHGQTRGRQPNSSSSGQDAIAKRLVIAGRSARQLAARSTESCMTVVLMPSKPRYVRRCAP